jgi:hypothetical protein
MKIILWITLILAGSKSYSQNENFAASVGVQFMINCKEVKTLLNARIGYKFSFNVWNKTYVDFIPSISFVHSRGSIGSAVYSETKNKHRPNSFLFLSGQGLIKSLGKKAKNFDVPVYTFSNYLTPLFYDSSAFSFHLGSNFIRDFKHNQWQRVGTGGVNINNFVISYSNDGPPYHLFFFGDGKDRLFTGALTMSWSALKDREQVLIPNRLEASYHKYTGYEEDTYELSTLIRINQIFYENEATMHFNQSEWQFNVQNNYNGHLNKIGFAWTDAYSADLQHIIHHSRYFSQHISPIPKRFSFVASGSYLTFPIQ